MYMLFIFSIRFVGTTPGIVNPVKRFSSCIFKKKKVQFEKSSNLEVSNYSPKNVLHIWIILHFTAPLPTPNLSISPQQKGSPGIVWVIVRYWIRLTKTCLITLQVLTFTRLIALDGSGESSWTQKTQLKKILRGRLVEFYFLSKVISCFYQNYDPPLPHLLYKSITQVISKSQTYRLSQSQLVSKLIPAYIADLFTKKRHDDWLNLTNPLYSLTKVSQLVYQNIFKFLIMGKSGTTAVKH